jgi:phosphomannomutase
MEIFLFDVDGTICESGKKISEEMAFKINKLIIDNSNKIGIVGGGTFEKILFQLDNLVHPHYIFSECGSVYHELNMNKNSYKLIHKNNIRDEPEYKNINILVKICLVFLSQVDYTLSGNFIDLRNGLIYVSLVGMVATDEERENFIELDKIENYRCKLIDILKKKAIELKLNEYLDICLGGSVGIAIYPKKWNKTQVLNFLDTKNTKIHFFGDKYLPNGNDYELLNNECIIPHPVDSTFDTSIELDKLNLE